MSEVFRSATVAPSETTSDTPTARSTDAKSPITPAQGGIYTSEALTGAPITVKHFDLTPFWESDTAEMRDGIKAVDEWVQSKARERGLGDSKESYNEIIDGILKQIGKSPNEKPLHTFERVQNAIEAFNRMEKAKLQPILDVKNMTADEYKKTRA